MTDAPAAQRAEPLVNYEFLDPKEIVEQLDKLSEPQLEAIRTYESSRDKPRSKVLDEVDHRLDAIEANRQENQVIGDPAEQKKAAKELAKRKPPKEGEFQEQAEKSASDPDVDDPVEPSINPGYIQSRDGLEAAKDGESSTHSGPDDLAIRDSAAQVAAEPLRQEAAENRAKLPETGSTHEVSSKAADAGEQYPPDPEDPDELVAKRDKDSAKAESQAESDAKKTANSLKGEKGLVAEAREGAPALPGDPENPGWEDEPPMSQPQGSALQVGDIVRRLDRAHDEIGPIVRRIPPIEAGLVVVQFPKAGEQKVNTNNLAYEGNPVTEKALAEAYATSDLRAF